MADEEEGYADEQEIAGVEVGDMASYWNKNK
jgi:hypothetical protein